MSFPWTQSDYNFSLWPQRMTKVFEGSGAQAQHNPSGSTTSASMSFSTSASGGAAAQSNVTENSFNQETINHGLSMGAEEETTTEFGAVTMMNAIQKSFNEKNINTGVEIGNKKKTNKKYPWKWNNKRLRISPLSEKFKSVTPEFHHLKFCFIIYCSFFSIASKPIHAWYETETFVGYFKLECKLNREENETWKSWFPKIFFVTFASVAKFKCPYLIYFRGCPKLLMQMMAHWWP